MAIITFKGNGSKETGNTAAAVAVATYMAIEHNLKILLISTSLNDDSIKECFWGENTTKKSLFSETQSKGANLQSGIEGLSKMLSSGKIEPRIVRDYTKVVLNGRLDVLNGLNGDKERYEEIQENYSQVISVANQYYDMVIVDLDKRLNEKNKENMIQISDVIVITTCQKVKDIQTLAEYMSQNNFITDVNTLVVIGRYDDYLKCNVKNVTRNLLRKRKNINSIPYNGKYYEAMKDGTVIDLFLNFLRIKNTKDHGYFFIQELKRLTEDINERWEEVQKTKSK